jgi:5-methylthioribose kinase
VPARDLRSRFEQVCGPRFFLDPGDPGAIDCHLKRLGWIDQDRVLEAERIGDGNMNLTVRLRFEHRRPAILKQARPWVEKYPQIAAPLGRAGVEAAFYTAVTREPAVSGRMPTFLGADPDAFLIFLEDLRDAEDLSILYGGARLTPAEREELIEYLIALHALDVAPGDRGPFRNVEMRALNHAHQFEIPLRDDNGVDLDAITPGLAALAAGLRRDDRYRTAVTAAGSICPTAPRYFTATTSPVRGSGPI